MRLLICLFGLFIAGCVSTQNFVEKSAITEAKLTFPQFAQHSENASDSIDHSAFTEFLSTYAAVFENAQGPNFGATLIRYADVSDADRAALNAYVKYLQTAKVTELNRDEQLAFWINLYNAETIRVILENYPVESIRNIKSSPLDFKGPWNDARLKVQGETLTLDNIENRIVRPLFNDPRIHYAFNCAAIGCPNLRETAYRAEGLDAALDEQAREFVNNPRGVKTDGSHITVSKIYLWYKKDFGDSEAEVLDHIRRYAEPGLADALKSATSIKSYEYDWSLNSAR